MLGDVTRPVWCMCLDRWCCVYSAELSCTTGKTSSKVRFQSLVEGWAWQFGLLGDKRAAVADAVATVDAIPDSGVATEAAAEAAEVGVSRMYSRVTRYWQVCKT